MNAVIDVHARPIVGRHNERVLRRLRILLRDGRNALVMSPNFVHPALLIEILDRFPYVTPCELFNDLFQLGVLLPHDLFQLYSLHTSILQLCEGASSLDRFVLSPISNQQGAIIWT